MTHRRITGRQVAEGEDADLAAAIAGEQREGVLQGVTVDFRHVDLPESDWEARPFWYVWGPPPSHAGIMFPVEAQHRAEQTSDRWASGDDDEGAAPVYVYAGDRLSVDHVVPSIKDRRFDHPHDAQNRLAYLKIERPSGEVVTPPGPLAFYGRTQIRDGALRETFDHIMDRICTNAGVGSLHDRDPHSTGFASGYRQLWTMEIEDAALAQAREAHDSYFRLLASLPAEGVARAHLRSLANSAALAGFLLAKAEARKAESIGGAAMANLELAREARTNTGWRDKAKAIWKEHPTWKTHRVAKEVVAEFGGEMSSVQRAIGPLAPPSSPSYKGA